jgi:subtilisin family serine protease
MKIAAALLVLAVVACDTAPVEPERPQAIAATRQGYIVTVDPSVDVPRLVERLAVPTAYMYTQALTGFATKPVTAGQAEALRHAKGVLAVEPDGIAFVDPSVTTSAPAWGIDRIDQRKLPLSGTYSYISTGAGKRIYIVDTGIRYSHTQFGGRAVFGWDYSGGDGSDCRGHGTHVAGTAGGSTYGVARSATLVSVRVFGCTGGAPYSTIIAALDFIATQPIGVVNMSLGGPAHAATDAAVNSLAARGFAVAVAAGNNGANACNYSPARAASAMTVGATTRSDDKASYSNSGTCVDLYAPGSSILSAYYNGDAATASLSGTSMASPHVAGVLARRMGQGLSARAAEANIIQTATPRIPRMPHGAKGILLYADPAS